MNTEFFNRLLSFIEFMNTSVYITGWPQALENRENRENGKKNSLQGKIREFRKIVENQGKIREFISLNVFICFKIIILYTCSYANMATGGFVNCIAFSFILYWTHCICKNQYFNAKMTDFIFRNQEEEFMLSEKDLNLSKMLHQLVLSFLP